VEAAAYQRGDIKAICQLVRPDFGIVTSIGWMHLERFGTLENIRQTKMEVVPFIVNKKKLFIPPEDHRIIDAPEVCLSIGKQLGISPSQIKNRIKAFTPPEHRLATKKISRDLIYLDDSYNSNPLGFKKALGELAKYKNYQKIIITPGVIEFGEKQNDINEELASEFAKIGDIFVIVGKTNQEALSRGARNAKKIIFLDKNQNYDEVLTPLLRPPTAILLENELPDHYL
jgi:UDP-N-acetylmuramyl pentapeptide synthase